MKKAPHKKKRQWQSDRLHALIKIHIKRYYKKRIVGQEIQRIWNDYIQEEIIKGLEVGSVVKLDKHSTIWVKATPFVKHKKAMQLFQKGLMYQGGGIVPLNINLDTSKYIYKIMYENVGMNKEHKYYFEPHRDLKKAVNEGIKKGKLVTRFEK